MPKPKEKTKTSNKSSKAVSKKPEVFARPPSAYKIMGDSIQILRRQWKTFAIILLIYLVMTILFSSGLGSSKSVSQLKSNVSSSAHGGSSDVKTGVDVFGSLIGTTLASSVTNGDGQTFLFVIFSLMFIWLFREMYLGKKPKARDAIYKSLAPLISFFLVLLLLFAEMIPASIGAYIFATISNNAISVGGFEKTAIWIVFILLIAVSLYLFVSTVFALYIVTLPDMRPIKAIRSSWGLVKRRRILFFRKVLFLPVVLILVGGLVSVLFITIIPVVAGWVFLLLTIISVAIMHSYMYTLYRESL